MSKSDNTRSELMQPLFALEENVGRLETFCRMCDALAGDDPPDWLVHVWELVRGTQAAMEPVGRAVREMVNAQA